MATMFDGMSDSLSSLVAARIKSMDPDYQKQTAALAAIVDEIVSPTFDKHNGLLNRHFYAVSERDAGRDYNPQDIMSEYAIAYSKSILKSLAPQS